MKWIWLAIAFSLACIVGVVGYKYLSADYHYTSQATITVDAPQETVFRLVGNLRNWNRWSPFLPANAPDVQIDQTTSPPTMIWADPRGGKAILTLDRLDAVGGEIDHTLTSQIFPNMTGQFELKNTGAQQTRVTWKVEGELPHSFFYALASSNYGELLGAQLKDALTRLKTVAEKENSAAVDTEQDGQQVAPAISTQ